MCEIRSPCSDLEIAIPLFIAGADVKVAAIKRKGHYVIINKSGIYLPRS